MILLLVLVIKEYLIMNMLIWNCRGALNPSFHSIICDLVQSHRPAIMILTETKVSGSEAKDIYDKLPFDGAFHANKFGFVWFYLGSLGLNPSRIVFSLFHKTGNPLYCEGSLRKLLLVVIYNLC